MSQARNATSSLLKQIKNAEGLRLLQTEAAKQANLSASQGLVRLDRQFDRQRNKIILPQRKLSGLAGSSKTLPQYYAGKNVFLTGATGFCGKPVIEKLLRACPDIQGIYCLTRPKKGQSSEQRIREMFDDPLFDSLKVVDQDQTFRHKLHAVEGDIAYDDFGINDKIRQHLFDNIDIFVHSAATINFNDPIDVAVNMNILGSRRAIKLARGMKNLDSYLHMSTAYAYANRRNMEVKEEVYEPTMDYKDLIEKCRTGSKDELKALEKKVVGEYPNTYSVTKGITEYMLMQEASDLPLAMIRPSVVVSTYKDPFSGWIDKNALQGFPSMFYWLGRGTLRIMKGKLDNHLDVVPADLVANSMLGAIWQTGTQASSQPRIYNITSSPFNPCSVRLYRDVATRTYREVPFEKSVAPASKNWITDSMPQYHFWNIMSHWMPALYKDAKAKLSGKRTKWLKVAYMNEVMNDNLPYFQSNEFYYETKNYEKLINSMTPEDAQTFWCDPREIDWESAMAVHALGIKRFIGGEALPDKLPSFAKVPEVERIATHPHDLAPSI